MTLPLSAEPVLGRGFGLLVLDAQVNRPGDEPQNNETFGIVTAPPGISNDDYFSILETLTLNCCGGADYDLFPELATNGTGYNSNSFVSGLIQLTRGQITLTRNENTPGFNTPLPGEFFGL